MSSAMMTRMFGFCCCADAGAPATITDASDASRPKQTFLLMFIDVFPVLPSAEGSLDDAQRPGNAAVDWTPPGRRSADKLLFASGGGGGGARAGGIVGGARPPPAR